MADKQKKDNFFKRIASYLKATKSEVKKVTWPSKKQVVNNTGIVILCIAVVAAFIFLLNVIFGFSFSFLSGGSNENMEDVTDPTVVEDVTDPTELETETDIVVPEA